MEKADVWIRAIYPGLQSLIVHNKLISQKIFRTDGCIEKDEPSFVRKEFLLQEREFHIKDQQSLTLRDGCPLLNNGKMVYIVEGIDYACQSYLLDEASP